MELEHIKKTLMVASQELASNARASLREKSNSFSMMVTSKTGLISAIQLRTLLLRRIQAVLALIMVQRLRDHSPVLASNAKDLFN